MKYLIQQRKEIPNCSTESRVLSTLWYWISHAAAWKIITPQ